MQSVLVAREFDEFSRILAKSGFAVINCPTIETAESEDLSDLESKIERIEEYNGIFFTSPRAAEIFLKKRQSSAAYPGRIYVLGVRARDLFDNRGFDVFYNEYARDANEMLASIPKDELAGGRFLFVRGRRSLSKVSEVLGAIAAVDEAVVYETRAVCITDAVRAQIDIEAAAGRLVAACFFSPSGAESMLAQLESRVFDDTCIAAIGLTTAGFLAERGLSVDLISKTAEAGVFARELIGFLRREG